MKAIGSLKWGKKYLIIPAAVLLSVMIMVGGSIYISWGKRKNRDDIMNYLKNKYQTDFIMENSTEKNQQPSGAHTFLVYPADNHKIIFTVKSGFTEDNIFPFLPPMKRPYISDDFSDQIKAYTIAENDTVISQINIQDTKDVAQAAEKIYSLMEEINRHLAHYNINVTDYTCSAELSILIKEEKRQIKFYQKNISVIENLLFKNMQ